MGRILYTGWDRLGIPGNRGCGLGTVTMDSGQMLRYVQASRWPAGQVGATEGRQTLEEVNRKFWREIRERAHLAWSCWLPRGGRRRDASEHRPSDPGDRPGGLCRGWGDVAQQIETAHRDEIGQLADEFDWMASTL